MRTACLLAMFLPACVDYTVRAEVPLTWRAECPDESFPGWDTWIDADCQNEVATGTFSPVVEWYRDDWEVEPGVNDVMTAPIVLPLTDDNGDGAVDHFDVPDIAVISFLGPRYWDSGVLRVLSGDDGREVVSVPGLGLQGSSGLAGGDLDHDGVAEIVALTQEAVVAFEHDGTVKWTSPSLTGHISGTSDCPALADLDGDGSVEVIAGRAILRADGSVRGYGAFGMGGVGDLNVGTAPVAADLDGDGIQEVVVGNAAYGPDGQTLWSNGEADGYPAVADFDADREAEIAVGGGGVLRLQETDGSVLWSVPVPGAEDARYGGPPTVADYDGDGAPEIGVASGSRYTVFEADGSILWQNLTNDATSGNTGSAVFDFEGDGVAEVVYADETTLWVYSGVDGTVKLESFEHSNRTWLEYPVVADVDADGHAEIVVVDSVGVQPVAGVHVFGDADDSWRPGRRIWNQHAYSITNVDADAGIPATPELNWLGYNNFRSGDMTAGDGMDAPDLTLEEAMRCELDCERDEWIVWVHVGNEGAVDLRVPCTLEAVAVLDGEEVVLWSATYEDGMPVGRTSDSVQIELDVSAVKEAERLVVRAVAAEMECDLTNNELAYDGPFCVW
jgi:hypothetical protein